MSSTSPWAAPAACPDSCDFVDQGRLLDSLVNNLEGMAFRGLADDARTMHFVSVGCHQLTGYPPSEVLEGGHTCWMDIVHIADRARVRRKLQWAALSGRRLELRYRILTTTGELKWVLERSAAVTQDDGEVIFEGFIEDVTAHIRTMEALARAERRYRHIFEHATEGIFQSSLDGRYLTANTALARMYG